MLILVIFFYKARKVQTSMVNMHLKFKNVKISWYNGKHVTKKENIVLLISFNRNHERISHSRLHIIAYLGSRTLVTIGNSRLRII